MYLSEAEIMIGTHLAMVTKGTHNNITEGYESIQKQFQEHSDWKFVVEDPEFDFEAAGLIEDENPLNDYITTLNDMIFRYAVSRDNIKYEYENTVKLLICGLSENSENNKILKKIADELMQRDIRIMDIVIPELRELNKILVDKLNSLSTDIPDDIETYIDEVVQQTMNVIEEKIALIEKK